MVRWGRSLGLSAALLTAAIGLTACAPPILDACPAIGYVNDGPAVLETPTELPKGTTLAACFGTTCEAEPVPRTDGRRWEVPQEPPYLDASAVPLGGPDIRVVITDAEGLVVADRVYEIPIRGERTGVFGQCPGPASYAPVDIDGA